MTIMKRHDTFLYKSRYLSLFLERSKILYVCVRERHGDGGCRHWLADGCYIDPFLIHIVILYSGPYVLCFLDEKLSSGVLSGQQPLTTHSTQHNWGDSPYLCIYNFLILMQSSGPWFTWSASTCQLMQTDFLFI